MLVLKLPHSSHFMAKSVDCLCVGPKSEMLGLPVQNLFMKPLRRLSKLSRECKLLVIAKRVTPITSGNLGSWDHEVRKLRRSRIPIIKVRWNSKRGPEFTWEREDQFREKYPHP
ncbi:hypothetical protein Tco_0081673 [Tanacetum coccineum]